MAKKISKEEQLEGLMKFLKRKAKGMRIRKTVWEQSLYTTLKDLHYNFKNQVPIICQNKYGYIIDFLLVDYNLIIEVDGKSTHSSKEQQKADNQRSRRLKKEGYYILRFWNKQVSTLSKETIDQIIKTKIKLLLNVKNVNKLGDV
jgi:very-short-patch-repair endonuclease